MMANPLFNQDRCRKLLENLVIELTNGLEQFDSHFVPKARALKKTINLLVEQSVAVNRAVVDKDFLDEFPDVKVKEKILSKITSALEGEIFKLNTLLDELEGKVTKYQSLTQLIENFNLDSQICEDNVDVPINLFNACELARDCVQMNTVFFLNLQIAAANIDYDSTSSLKPLELALAESKDLEAAIYKKKEEIMQIISVPPHHSIELLVVPKR